MQFRNAPSESYLSIQVVGVLVLALGIYLLVEGQTYDFVTGREAASGAALLVASGVITFCIAAVGFVGACFKWRPFLGIVSTATA